MAALLQPRETGTAPSSAVAAEVLPEAAAALRYTRDRICVPRDMGLTAARQLRAHLNFIADAADPGAKCGPGMVQDSNSGHHLVSPPCT